MKNNEMEKAGGSDEQYTPVIEEGVINTEDIPF